MERPYKYDRETKFDDNNNNNSNERTESSIINYIRTSRVLSFVSPNTNSEQSITTANEQENTIDFLLTKEIYEATEDLSFIANQMRSACHYEEIRDDWKYIASVIDRLQLYVFFAVTSFGTLSILLNAPYILTVVDQYAILKNWDPTFGTTS